MMNLLRLFSIMAAGVFLVALGSCQGDMAKAERETVVALTAEQEAIVERYLVKEAWHYPVYSQDRQDAIDEGLALDSTIAYLWQQKAMPLFKQGKYEAGMVFIDKAVEYDPVRYLDYRAFIKCIFAKTYHDAIVDFEACLARDGNSYVMDHSYNFYMALCHLQLNDFAKAETMLSREIETVIGDRGEDGVHHLTLFYLGVSEFEQRKYEEAIATFDKALARYPQFSDAQYYKAYSLAYLDYDEKATLLFAEAKANAASGYSINEDNSIYERYPYQVRW